MPESFVAGTNSCWAHSGGWQTTNFTRTPRWRTAVLNILSCSTTRSFC